MKKNLKNRGFTLVEVLIYIVLFGMLMSGAVIAAYQLLDGGQRQDISFISQQEGTFVNRKLAWALAPASNVTASPDGKVLTITRPDLGAESPLVVDASGVRVYLKRANSPDSFALTTDGLPLSDATFSVSPAANGLPKSVRVAFSLAGKPFAYAMYLRQ